MPFTLLTPGKGGQTIESIPSFFVSGPGKKVTQLKKFLDMVQTRAFEYYTENKEAGWDYISRIKDQINLKEVINNASEKVQALIELAMEEGFSQDRIKKLIYDSLYIEPGTDSINENQALKYHIDYVEIPLDSFKGKINKVTYDNVYEALCEDLSEDELESAFESVRSVVEDDTMEVSVPYSYWLAYIDEEEFKDNLLKEMQMQEDEAEERKPAAASYSTS